MEQEFYELEHFRGDPGSFLDQAWASQLWFNYARENSGKGHRTPEQLRAERAPWVHPKVYALPLCYCLPSQPTICLPPGKSWVRIYLGMSFCPGTSDFPNLARRRPNGQAKVGIRGLRQPEGPSKTRLCTGTEHQTQRGTSGRLRGEQTSPRPGQTGRGEVTKQVGKRQLRRLSWCPSPAASSASSGPRRAGWAACSGHDG
jgi:hypothetical protein